MTKPVLSTVDDEIDGRTARRDRNRDAVVDAVIELFLAGIVDPSAAQIAQRAGVSLRSVFRYFDDIGSLRNAAIERHFARVAPLFALDRIGEGPLPDRIHRFVAARLRLHAGVAVPARVATANASRSPMLADRLSRARQELRTQLEAMFAPELARLTPSVRRGTVATLDALCSLEGIDHLTIRLGLTSTQAADALRRALAAQLG